MLVAWWGEARSGKVVSGYCCSWRGSGELRSRTLTWVMTWGMEKGRGRRDCEAYWEKWLTGYGWHLKVTSSCVALKSGRMLFYYCRNGIGSWFCSEGGFVSRVPSCGVGQRCPLELWEARFNHFQDKWRQACFHWCPGKCFTIIGWFVVLLSFVTWLDLLKNKLCSDT